MIINLLVEFMYWELQPFRVMKASWIWWVFNILTAFAFYYGTMFALCVLIMGNKED
jgi:hypothetical protein